MSNVRFFPRVQIPARHRLRGNVVTHDGQSVTISASNLDDLEREAMRVGGDGCSLVDVVVQEPASGLVA
jgi:hypothetical protein